MRSNFTIACLTATLFTALVAASPSAAAATATGRITAITAQPDGSAIVAGWACEPGSPAAVQVQLYVGEPAPAGQLVTAATADAETTAAACGAGGTRHGFGFNLPPATLFRYGGLRVFAYAVAPDHSGSLPIGTQAAAALPAYTPLTGPPRNCDITDIASLKRCIAQTGQYNQFSLRQDLTCTSAGDCCGANNGPLIVLDNLSRRVFDGNGHTIHHAAGALACGTIRASKSSDILIRNLTIDEGENVPPCELSTKDCPHTVLISVSKNVRLDDTHIYFGKGYVVYVWTTDGFAFVRSSLSESGIIGLYVGHFKFGPSKNVVIANSVFARTRTSAIALQGADSDDPQNPVLVMGNVLNKNHWHGLWPVPNVPGGITTGGQMLAGDGSNIRISGNIIGDGACENCVPRGQYVNAIEFADVVPAPGGVRGLTVDDNYFFNGIRAAIRHDPGSNASDVVIDNNRLVGFTDLDSAKIPVTRKRVLAPEKNPALAQAGAATYEVLRFTEAGQHHAARVQVAYPGAKLEGVFGLSPAPRPGASPAPLLHCMRAGAPGRDFISTDTGCGGGGQVSAVLGYSYEPGHPSVQPFYACRSTGAAGDEFLSWDGGCEGQKMVAQLGYAIRKSSPTPVPAAQP